MITNKKFDSVTAVILAGGKGTRLRSVVSDRQKVVAEVNGKPFLLRLIDQLDAAGIRKTVICTGYMADTVEAAFRQYCGNMEVCFSYETQPLGTGGAINNALSFIDTQYCLIMNGDSFVDLDLVTFCRKGNDMKNAALMVTLEVKDVSRYGKVTLENGGHKVIAFEEKGTASGVGLINAGIYFFEVTCLRRYFLGRKCFSIEKEVFPAMAASGILKAEIVNGDFIDIGTPESYLTSRNIIKD